MNMMVKLNVARLLEITSSAFYRYMKVISK